MKPPADDGFSAQPPCLRAAPVWAETNRGSAVRRSGLKAQLGVRCRGHLRMRQGEPWPAKSRTAKTNKSCISNSVKQ